MYWCMSNVKFGMWLQSAAEERGITLADVAKRGGVSSATIWRIANGERNVGIDSLLAIAQGLRMSPVEVFRIATGQPQISDYEDLINLYNQLDEADKTTILRMMEVMLDK